MSRLNRIIEQLRSGDPSVREDGLARLEAISDQGLTFEEGREALLAAAEFWTADEEFDPYLELRAHATLLLDLMSYIPDDRIIATFGDASRRRDPRVRHFAVLDLIQQGHDAPEAAVESVAASAEMRNSLHEMLESLGRLDLFPGRFSSQEAFAVSNRVYWLTYPTELGRTPHDIELMATFDEDQGRERYYLFRFRTHASHWAAEDGWMAGLSGPFEVAATPTTDDVFDG